MTNANILRKFSGGKSIMMLFSVILNPLNDSNARDDGIILAQLDLNSEKSHSLIANCHIPLCE